MAQGQAVTLAIISQQTTFEVSYEKSGTLGNLLKALEPQLSPFDCWMVESLEEGVKLAMKEEDSFSQVVFDRLQITLLKRRKVTGTIQMLGGFATSFKCDENLKISQVGKS